MTLGWNVVGVVVLAGKCARFRASIARFLAPQALDAAVASVRGKASLFGCGLGAARRQELADVSPGVHAPTLGAMPIGEGGPGSTRLNADSLADGVRGSISAQ